MVTTWTCYLFLSVAERVISLWVLHLYSSCWPVATRGLILRLLWYYTPRGRGLYILNCNTITDRSYFTMFFKCLGCCILRAWRYLLETLCARLHILLFSEFKVYIIIMKMQKNMWNEIKICLWMWTEDR